MGSVITTRQYATIRKNIYEVQLNALRNLASVVDDEVELQFVQTAIDGCLDWISHYDEMICDLEV